MARRPFLSVVLVVRNVEDSVGADVRRLHRHLCALELSFEIVAVNGGSRDNSFAVLRLVAAELPGLSLHPGGLPARAIVRGAAMAQGDLLLLFDRDPAQEHGVTGAQAGGVPSLAPLGWALSRLERGRQAVVLRGRFLLARRLPVLPVIVRARGRGAAFERSFEREAHSLLVDVAGRRARAASLFAPVLRLLAV
jgi:glycosyltransferase involved in cell wall biosynthesis